MRGPPRFNVRTALAIAHDLIAALIAWWLAFWLRLNLELPAYYLQVAWQSLPAVLAVQAVILWRSGLYRGIWRYASLHDLRRILIAAGACALAVPAVLVLARLAAPIPRSVFLLDPLLLLLMMGGSRLAYRSWKEGRIARLTEQEGKPVLVLGAGDVADKLIRELSARREWNILGLLDDDVAKQGREIHGVRVRGRLKDVGRVASELEVAHAIVAMPSAANRERRKAVHLASAAGLQIMTVPSFNDIMSGRVTVSQLRPVELDDLLGRDPVVLDNKGLELLLTGKTVMISGAGGSIGSELCRQIAGFRPARLIMLELSEFALYQIEQEFCKLHPELTVVCAVGDVRNRLRMEQMLGEYRPQVLFHAAAYKHVPLMEEVNAWEAVQNNVLGTHVIAAAAARHGVEKFVLVSTDKAVNPVNVMGAAKRAAEMVCQALQSEHGPRYVMVRFGNVLGSAGSVIPKFRQQIAEGGPLTVTHPDITRYFMSIPEAAQLVLQAGAMGRGGEIFVLDMGEAVRIVDLAKEMIRLSGLGENDIRIVFTGLRPGEKLYEEVLADEEGTLPTPHQKLRIARARDVDRAWLEELLAWLDQPRVLADHEVREGLARWVAEYRHPAAPGDAVTNCQPQPHPVSQRV